MPDLPLLRRFPELRDLPRAAFGEFPTRVERIALADGRVLLVKRDDRSGQAIGGNKVRSLEWLLGDIRPPDQVLTVGPRGSTHALATARCARLRGVSTTVLRWDQEMNDAARRVDSRMRREARTVDVHWMPAAYAVAGVLRMRRDIRWIPAGGLSPVGMLGHVNAAFELADQIERGECEMPDRVYVPLGTGGTAAGLTLGFSIRGLATQVVAVRVVPRVLGRARRVLALASATATFIERRTGGRLGRPHAASVRVEHGFYGGAYGRRLQGVVACAALELAGITLDDTYSAKTFAAVMAASDHLPLLWLTFDGRLLQD